MSCNAYLVICVGSGQVNFSHSCVHCQLTWCISKPLACCFDVNSTQQHLGCLFSSHSLVLSQLLAYWHRHLDVQVGYLPVFWKQQHMLFFDSFSFALPTFLMLIPFSLASSLVWMVITYFPVGLAGEPSRSALSLRPVCFALCTLLTPHGAPIIRCLSCMFLGLYF